MGFLKSIRETQQLSREISKNWDPAQQRRDGMAQMAAAQEMMAQTTRAANVAATGVAATATVAAATQTGAMINMEPVVELSLTVISASGLPPYRATLTQPISQVYLARVGAGSTLNVKVDPTDPQSIWIDFLSAAC
ncbi:MAG TPA: hypothetical protein VN740_02575 [Solirubrobacteraceae bacterium]|nr:hypothetical protein [Solirubrobacteraceae bacterium]